MNEALIISSAKNWLEQKAVEQLKKIALYPGVVKAIGLPDLHPGKTPVGAVLITEGIIYPHFIGNDIGCGMSLFITEINKQKNKTDKMVKRLEVIPNIRDIDFPNNLMNQVPENFWTDLGTIGGGNHFAELQEVDAVYDVEQFHNLNLNKDTVTLLVHSGSRRYGQQIMNDYLAKYPNEPSLQAGSEACSDYLAKHDDVVQWADLNRKVIGYRFLKALGTETRMTELVNSTHNSISIKECEKNIQFIHRKGAAPADQGVVVIPGSRGTLTYLVIPTGDISYSGYSLAHGAGRKWERTVCKARLESKYTKESIKTTQYKSKIIYRDSRLLFEEAPEAYKNIDLVIQSFVELGLLKIIATFKPMITYKG